MREGLKKIDRSLRNLAKSLLAKGKTEAEISEVLKGGHTRILAHHVYDEEECGRGTDLLYMLIKKGREDVLVNVGIGDFSKEKFLNTPNAPWGLSHTSIPLFVVEEGNEEEKENPKKYLGKYATIIITPSKGPEERKPNETIDFGRINIMNRDKAEEELQKSLFKKLTKGFSEKTLYDVIQEIGVYSELELMNRAGEKKQAHFEKEEIENALRTFINICIRAEAKEIYQVFEEMKSYIVNGQKKK